MKMRFGGINLATACVATALLGSPLAAMAQADPITPGAPDPGQTNKRVTIDVENANLYAALSLLFGQIKANFTLDPSLKQASVTAHLHNIPFETALDTLLNGSGLPLTHQTSPEGIISIVPKIAPDAPLPVEPGPIEEVVKPKIKFKRLTGFTTNASSLVMYFKTKGEVLQSSMMMSSFGQGGLGGGQGGFGGGQGGFGGGQGGFGGGQGGFGGGGFGGGGQGGFGGGGFGGGGQGGFGGGGFGGGGQGGFGGGGGGNFGGGGGGYGGGRGRGF